MLAPKKSSARGVKTPAQNKWAVGTSLQQVNISECWMRVPCSPRLRIFYSKAPECRTSMYLLPRFFLIPGTLICIFFRIKRDHRDEFTIYLLRFLTLRIPSSLTNCTICICCYINLLSLQEKRKATLIGPVNRRYPARTKKMRTSSPRYTFTTPKRFRHFYPKSLKFPSLKVIILRLRIPYYPLESSKYWTEIQQLRIFPTCTTPYPTPFQRHHVFSRLLVPELVFHSIFHRNLVMHAWLGNSSTEIPDDRSPVTRRPATRTLFQAHCQKCFSSGLEGNHV